jgi:hypothetical protein
MILGGDFGSERKMWWISFSAAYRSGFAGIASGTLGSRVTLISNALLLNGVEEPKDPMTIDAAIGFDEVRNWNGRSFWAYAQLAKVSIVTDQ